MKTMKQLIFFILIITSLSLNAQGVKIQPKNCTTPTVDTDIKLLFSIVNDSIRIDSFDNKLGVIVGSPQFIDDAINKPDLVQSAQHDLRLNGTAVERGSDDSANPKGAAFLHNSFSHLNGFSDNWVSSNFDFFGNNRPTLSLKSNGDIHSGYDGSSPTSNPYGNLFFRASDGAFSVANNYYNWNTTALGNGAKNFGQFGLATGDHSINFATSGVASNVYSVNFGAGGHANALQSINAGFNGTVDGIHGVNFGRQGIITVDGQVSNNFGDDGKVQSLFASNFAQKGDITIPYSSYFGSSPIVWSPAPASGFSNGNLAEKNPLLVVGNGIYNANSFSYPSIPYISNSLTHLADGSTQINNTGFNLTGTSMTQESATPVAALEVVSITKGVLVPRLTSSQVTDWQNGFNTTTDVTGLNGVGDEKHSRQGELVYNLSTSLFVSARWNGTSWNFATF